MFLSEVFLTLRPFAGHSSSLTLQLPQELLLRPSHHIIPQTAFLLHYLLQSEPSNLRYFRILFGY